MECLKFLNLWNSKSPFMGVFNLERANLNANEKQKMVLVDS